MRDIQRLHVMVATLRELKARGLVGSELYTTVKEDTARLAKRAGLYKPY